MASQSSSSSSSQSYLADLKDGVNFHVIPGKHSKSKLIIKDDFAYTVDKKVLLKEETGKYMFYIRCKFKDCKVRGTIKKDFLSLSDTSVHTCQAGGSAVGKSKWLAQAALARMRHRACTEPSSYDVSITIIYH